MGHPLYPCSIEGGSNPSVGSSVEAGETGDEALGCEQTVGRCDENGAGENRAWRQELALAKEFIKQLEARAVPSRPILSMHSSSQTYDEVDSTSNPYHLTLNMHIGWDGLITVCDLIKEEVSNLEPVKIEGVEESNNDDADEVLPTP